MNPVLKIFLDLLFLRQGPQALPDSLKLLRVLLVLNVLFSLGVLQQSLGWKDAFIHVGLMLGLLAGLTYGILAFKRLTPRFKQTFTALLGVDFILTILHWVLEVTGIISPLAAEGTLGTAAFEMGLLIWTLLIQGNIFRHALSISLFKGCWVGVILVIISLVIFSFISPSFKDKAPPKDLEPSLESLGEDEGQLLNNTTRHFEGQFVTARYPLSPVR
ncbi:MAG: hypothetical protein HY559_03610 [Gammaproteobacteria bacterium]|nr:hypothetical protein [Gammaproteobacteria bacterium]